MAKKDETPKEEELEVTVEDVSSDELAEETESEEAQTDDEAEDKVEEATESEEESEEEVQPPKFDKRYPRFKGETPEEYIKNLEDAYANSSGEAVRLNREVEELKTQGLAKIANSESEEETTPPPAQSPALAWAEEQRNKEWKKDWEEFSESHPEILEDEALFKQFDSLTGDMFMVLKKQTNSLPTLGEAMTAAWKVLSPDKISKEEQIAMKTKDAGADTKAKGVSKEMPKPKFSDAQIEAAIKMDQKLQGKTRAEIEEILSKYV